MKKLLGFIENNRKILSVLLFGLVALFQVIDTEPLIAFNKSQSLPHKVFYRNVFKKDPRFGDLVSFKKGNEKVIKKVIGLPGDSIVFKTNRSYVSEIEVGPVFSYNPESGKSFHPINLESVPDGCFFVAGTHPESFDSRYEEFGVLLKSEVLGCYEILL